VWQQTHLKHMPAPATAAIDPCRISGRQPAHHHCWGHNAGFEQWMKRIGNFDPGITAGPGFGEDITTSGYARITVRIIPKYLIALDSPGHEAVHS
jgi:hypothetical protein